MHNDRCDTTHSCSCSPCCVIITCKTHTCARDYGFCVSSTHAPWYVRWVCVRWCCFGFCECCLWWWECLRLYMSRILGVLKLFSSPYIYAWCRTMTMWFSWISTWARATTHSDFRLFCGCVFFHSRFFSLEIVDLKLEKYGLMWICTFGLSLMNDRVYRQVWPLGLV